MSVKITAITGPGGELVAIVHAHLSEHAKAAPRAGHPHATLTPQRGQTFHELVAPAHLHDRPHAELRGWVVEHLGQK